MIIDEDNFTVALHNLADHDPITAAPTVQVLRRARRAQRGRTVALTAAALAVVTVAGGLAVGRDRRGPAGTTATATATADGIPTAVPVETPALLLVAAVQASAQTSFRFSMTMDGRSVEFGKEKALPASHYTGAYDPRVPKGYAVLVGHKLEQRLIGKDLYVQKITKWFKQPATPGQGLIYNLDDIGVLNPMATVDFVNQFATLKKAGTVTKTSATSYSFSFNWKPGDPDQPAVIPVAGTVQIDAKSGLVTAMSYDYVLAYPKGEADAKFYHSARWVYSDYGRPVEVTAPPNVTELVRGK